jgi:ABC-type transport system involved in cytochrome bd biosynthesis fused ATPase/permease subunit
MLRDPLNVMPQVLMAYHDATISLGHITTFLNTEGTQPEPPSSVLATSYEDQVAVGFDTASTFEWSPENFKLIINRQLLFPPGKLSIISGSSKSGKTSLFAALLGDMPSSNGSVSLPSRYLQLQQGTTKNLVRDLKNPNLYLHKVAYVAQQAWIEHGTIRENILFSEGWDDTRYRAVLHQCDLLRDLSLFDNGDLTSTSDRGISGSGKKI